MCPVVSVGWKFWGAGQQGRDDARRLKSKRVAGKPAAQSTQELPGLPSVVLLLLSVGFLWLSVA